HLSSAPQPPAIFTVEENPRAARTEIDPAAAMVFRDHALEAYRPPQKLGDERRRRLFVNLRRTADLLEPAAMNHGHAVRQCHRFGLVVSDVKNRELEFQ